MSGSRGSPAERLPSGFEWLKATLLPPQGVRRRITKKSPQTLVVRPACRQQTDFCPYDVLRISRRATPPEVRKAYLRRSLECHPDKLFARLKREPSAFEVQQATSMCRQIAEAFDMLAKPHDDEGSGQCDGRGSCAGATARLLLYDLEVYKEHILVSHQSTPTLRALRTLASGERNHEDGSRETKHSVDGCIHARGTFYVVAVSWKNFRVFTSTTRSLEQALSWRAALTIMRQTAMTRLQSEGGTDHVLLDNEIRNCLKGQPDMDLRFRAEVSGKVTRITPNWQLTLSQLTRLQQAATSRGVKKERKMQTCWDQARAEVEADKELIAHLRKAELQKIDCELQRRDRCAGLLLEELGLVWRDDLEDALGKVRELDQDERSHRLAMLMHGSEPLALEWV